MAKSKVILPIVLLGGVFFMMVMSSSALLVLYTGKDDGMETDEYAESAEFGSRGERDFGAVCEEDDYATKILLATKQVGPYVPGKRHHRVSHIGVQCRKGGRKIFGVGSSGDMQTTSSCKNKNDGFIGFRTWTTNDAVQRIEPICDQYSQFQGGSGAGDLGSEVGDNDKYLCPSGQRLAGFSGTYSDQLKTIRGHCRA